VAECAADLGWDDAHAAGADAVRQFEQAYDWLIDNPFYLPCRETPRGFALSLVFGAIEGMLWGSSPGWAHRVTGSAEGCAGAAHYHAHPDDAVDFFQEGTYYGKDCKEQLAQARLLHDLFGPIPFRPIRLDPPWLSWNDGTVVKMAQHIYDTRDFSPLPI